VRRYAWLCAVMLVVGLGAEATALAGITPSPTIEFLFNVGFDPCSAVAVSSVCLLHIWSRPRSREILITALLGTCLTGAFVWITGRSGVAVQRPNAFCVGFGGASLAVLGWRALWGHRPDRARALGLFLPGALVIGSMILSMFFLMLGIALSPTTDDALLYAADNALGQPSFVVGRWLAALPPLASIASVVYNTLPVAFLALFAAHLRADPTHRRVPLLVFLVAPMVGYLVYQSFPAIGPSFAFQQYYPYAPPSVAEVLSVPFVPGDLPRNCMPSLHTTWALLLWWHARPLAGWFRALMGGYLAFTVLATLGFGLHYAVDLVVAVPFALAAQALLAPGLAATFRRRITVAAFGVTLVFAWLLVLRHCVALVTGWPWLIAAGALLTAGSAYVAEELALPRVCDSGRTREICRKTLRVAVASATMVAARLAGVDQPCRR
jgi:hypothetical protein